MGAAGGGFGVTQVGPNPSGGQPPHLRDPSEGQPPHLPNPSGGQPPHPRDIWASMKNKR